MTISDFTVSDLNKKLNRQKQKTTKCFIIDSMYIRKAESTTFKTNCNFD